MDENQLALLRDYQEDLTEQLTKANALSKLTLTKAFSGQPESTQHEYFWALNDFIEEAKNMSVRILNALLKGIPLERKAGQDIED
jgi:hypothetical protein